MSSLDIYFVTFNCGKALIDTQALAAYLFKPYHDSAGEHLPDIVVLSLQEIGPIAHAFLGGSFLQPYCARIIEAVQQATPQLKYRLVAQHNAGTTAIIILAKQEVADRIQRIEKADIGVGLWEMGNKGAAGIRLIYQPDGASEQIPLTFVAAHLAAGEAKFARRNLDWENIVKGLAFASSKQTATHKAVKQTTIDDESDAAPLLANSEDESHTVTGLYNAPSILFLGGDLNYRTSDKGPEKGEQSAFPQPTADVEDKRHYSHLLRRDQLDREKHANRTLQHLAEARIEFPPTYKYSPEDYHRSPPQIRGSEVESSTWYWAPHRYPSWCDRILFSNYLSDSSNSFKVLAYTALPIQPTTDHRPVVLATRLNLEATLQLATKDTAGFIASFTLDAHATQKRAAARRLEVVVGVLAYLTLTWEGNGLLLATGIGAVGGWLIIRSLMGM